MRNATGRRSMLLGIVLVLIVGMVNGQAMTQQLTTRLAEGPKLDSPFTTTALAKVISVELREEPIEQALRKVAKEANLRVLFSTDGLPANKNVSLSLSEVTIASALSEVLSGTNLDFLLTSGGLIVVVPKKTVEEETGTIVGRVLEARTNKPLVGANVMIEGTGLGAAADADGNFRIERVPPGKYLLRSTVVGYGKIAKNITVVAGQQTNMDFFHDETAVGLDEVVVTGVSFETRRREIPADIAVLSTKRIEQKNAANVTDLLKGEIAGVGVNTQGQYDYLGLIYLRGSSSMTGADFAKIYIDGVEVANPTYITTLDPKSIERIEVVRGPHAAALYGAEASAGVIQIITKKGSGVSGKLNVNAQVSAGYIQSNFFGKEVTPGDALPLKTDNTFGISGANDKLGFRANVSYNTTGEWIPKYDQKKLSLSTGVRFVEGPLVAELTALRSKRMYIQPPSTHQYNRWPKSLPAAYQAGGVFFGTREYVPFYQFELGEMALGLNVSYTVVDRWKHNLVMGQDNNTYDFWKPEPWYSSPSDTTQIKYNRIETRSTLRYNTAYQQRVGESFSVRLTAGAEYSSFSNNNALVANIKLNEHNDIVELSNTVRITQSLEQWTAGYNGLVELGYAERLFVTLSSSIKRDPRGYEGTYSTPLGIGMTYSQDVGQMQVRVRGQYGGSVKPVNPAYVVPANFSTSFYYINNFDLQPEGRSGWDAGVDVYWGTDASVSLTRFDEVGKNIVQAVTTKPGPPIEYQYQNIAKVGVSGYEVSARLRFGFVGLEALTLSANYSYSDNSILATNTKHSILPAQ